MLALLLVLGAGPAVGAEDDAAEPPKYPSLKILGFGEFNFLDIDQEGGVSESGFKEGQLVLHFVSGLSKRISFFAEVTLTATPDEFKTGVERAIVKFEYNDNLEAAFGRFHTPISWWNVAYHHGSWLQTTITRPLAVAFGSEFVPVHFVGGIAEGAIPSGAANLEYAAGIGNGRDETISRPGDAGDVNSNRAWFVKLASKPSRPYKLQLGASLYDDRITPPMGQDFDETILSAFAVFTGETPEVISEYFHMQREGHTTGERFDSDSYYVQVGYRLPVWKARLKPYARIDERDVANGEPVFTRTTDAKEYTIGIRIDAAALVAVKAEFRRQRFDQDPYIDGFFAQIAYTF